MFPELKNKPKTFFEKLFSVDKNIDGLKRILKRIKKEKNDEKDKDKEN
jgi:hypothetical protein